jgi:hypothetical protein
VDVLRENLRPEGILCEKDVVRISAIGQIEVMAKPGYI